MQTALAASNQEAYHDAEARLNFARAHYNAYKGADAWWRTEEAEAILADAYSEFIREYAEKCKEAYKLLLQIEDLFGEAHTSAKLMKRILSAVEAHTQLITSYGVPALREQVPIDFAKKLAKKAGETYSPKGVW